MPKPEELQITLDDPALSDQTDARPVQPATPLEQVATVMAALIDTSPDTDAYAEGTVVVATSAGVTVRMTVTSVSADAEDVMGDVLQPE